MECDVVIAWVDGSDPAHAAKRALHDPETVSEGATLETRFADRGELAWCLASVARFAPFVRRIHIVTDDQTPPHVDRFLSACPQWRDRIRIVDHREIFEGYERYLPTFNSLTIATMLHRIPDMAERFIYLNDDLFFARPIDASEYLTPTGILVQGRIRKLPSEAAITLKTAFRQIARRRKMSPNSLTQFVAARLAGRTRTYVSVGHHPHIYRRSTLQRFFERRPEILEHQLRYRFRSPAQFHVTALSGNLEVADGTSLRKPDDIGYYQFETGKNVRRWRNPGAGELIRNLRAGAYRSLCLQSLDEVPREYASKLIAALDEHYGYGNADQRVA